MPVTYSGRVVRPYPKESEVPSLVDIAVGLSRQPRFAGQTKRWWSVLDHTLYADELARKPLEDSDVVSEDEEGLRTLRLAVLLHDAHEAITADVPSDFKTPELRHQQQILDEGIYERYFQRPVTQAIRDFVHAIDRRALIAEARVIGPPVSRQRILELFGGSEEELTKLSLDESVLEGLLRALPNWRQPPFETWQEDHPQVQEFLRRVVGLL